MDHADAIQAVARWLKTNGHVVLIEPQAAFFAEGERPDILAYSRITQLSTVAEIKRSQADLDANKYKSGLGLGNMRYWATLPGIKVPDDDWGWLIVHPGGDVVEAKEARPRDLAHFFLHRERHLFALAAGRADQQLKSLSAGKANDAGFATWIAAVGQYVKQWDKGEGIPLHLVQKGLRDLQPSNYIRADRAQGAIQRAVERGGVDGIELIRPGGTRTLRIKQ